jgi:hypothetical protein
MHYLVLIDNDEVEISDEKGVEESFHAGRISLETWIKLRDVESDWETVEEKFPHLASE